MTQAEKEFRYGLIKFYAIDRSRNDLEKNAELEYQTAVSATKEEKR